MRRRAWLSLVALAGSACGSEAEPVWQVVHEKLPGALLRVWGRSARDVYAVGGDADGNGSLVVHFDGDHWRRLETGTQGDLWWIDAVGEDDLRLVGEGGLILRYRPSTGVFERRAAPEPITLFGVWGAAPDDVWYVGGVIGGRGVIWRDDGAEIRAPLETTTATRTPIFKVHGFADRSVWMVGQGGQTARFDGARFVEPSSGTRLPLATVHGLRPDRVFAAGGFAEGALLAWDGAAWANETPPETPQMNGVWAASDDEVYAAGFNGRIFAREGGVWSELEGVPTLQDLHSVWVDEAGGVWASGGQLASDPPRSGVLVHHGVPVAAGLE